MACPLPIPEHTALPAAAATIAEAYADWLNVRKAAASSENAVQREEQYRRCRELQVSIVEQMAPLTARDLAIQLLVSTDYGDSDCSDDFIDRAKALANRLQEAPSANARRAKLDKAIAALRDAAQEYDPTILGVWVSRTEGDEPGCFTQLQGVHFNRSRKIQDSAARARGEMA
ncbi:hypothetical protein GCM10007989_05200 [Devosia pacifica]|uniref:Uncharacterized protein n=1 Tax=Devosia pacifica TaxID=1335967 RepID=A0A918VP06_9HYPH|nr:hypothetical protein [Devosia pacifica]GHA13564.1 hypothetical protein GCM10007989_05200 [Devosia pacifica]